MPAQEVSPFINGHRYSFHSIEITALGKQFFGVTRIAYASSLKPGHVRGSDNELIGRTEGDAAEHRAEMEMLEHECDVLIKALGPGWGLVPFDVTVQFDERLIYDKDSEHKPQGVKTHSLLGCRITERDMQAEEGPEAATVRLTLDPVTITYGSPDLSINWRPNIARNMRESG